MFVILFYFCFYIYKHFENKQKMYVEFDLLLLLYELCFCTILLKLLLLLHCLGILTQLNSNTNSNSDKQIVGYCCWLLLQQLLLVYKDIVWSLYTGIVYCFSLLVKYFIWFLVLILVLLLMSLALSLFFSLAVNYLYFLLLVSFLVLAAVIRVLPTWQKPKTVKNKKIKQIITKSSIKQIIVAIARLLNFYYLFYCSSLQTFANCCQTQ